MFRCFSAHRAELQQFEVANEGAGGELGGKSGDNTKETTHQDRNVNVLSTKNYWQFLAWPVRSGKCENASRMLLTSVAIRL